MDFDSAMSLNLCAAPARPSILCTEPFRTLKDTKLAQCLNHEQALKNIGTASAILGP